MGALFRIFKSSEIEPVYLIRPIDSDLVSFVCSDDEGEGEDAEEMDEYFYSAISPRECGNSSTSGASFPRNYSLERLNTLEQEPFGTGHYDEYQARPETEANENDNDSVEQLESQFELETVPKAEPKNIEEPVTSVQRTESPASPLHEDSSSDSGLPLPNILPSESSDPEKIETLIPPLDLSSMTNCNTAAKQQVTQFSSTLHPQNCLKESTGRYKFETRRT